MSGANLSSENECIGHELFERCFVCHIIKGVCSFEQSVLSVTNHTRRKRIETDEISEFFGGRILQCNAQQRMRGGEGWAKGRREGEGRGKAKSACNQPITSTTKL